MAEQDRGKAGELHRDLLMSGMDRVLVVSLCLTLILLTMLYLIPHCDVLPLSMGYS